MRGHRIGRGGLCINNQGHVYVPDSVIFFSSSSLFLLSQRRPAKRRGPFLLPSLLVYSAAVVIGSLRLSLGAALAFISASTLGGRGWNSREPSLCQGWSSLTPPCGAIPRWLEFAYDEPALPTLYFV